MTQASLPGLRVQPILFASVRQQNSQPNSIGRLAPSRGMRRRLPSLKHFLHKLGVGRAPDIHLVIKARVHFVVEVDALALQLFF